MVINTEWTYFGCPLAEVLLFCKDLHEHLKMKINVWVEEKLSAHPCGYFCCIIKENLFFCV